MSRFEKGIKIAPPTKKPFPETKIFWGDQDGGCERFPRNKSTITERIFSENPKHLKLFSDAVASAVDRVWIIDEYFLMPDMKSNLPDYVKQEKIHNRVDVILAWIAVDTNVNDVRILTKDHKEIDDEIFKKFEIREREINDRSMRRSIKCSIKVKTHLTERFNFVHDRFAIVDDELWHFGGTVGCFHSKVSAASRGWRASDHGAIDFFEMAWDAGEK